MTIRRFPVLVLGIALFGFYPPRAEAAPTIISQPTSTVVNLGSPVTVTVSALGTAPVTYQWFQFGAAIPGATSAALQITSTAATDAGAYSVVVTDPTGSVQSSEADIGVTTGFGNVATAINFENFTLGADTLAPEFTVLYSGSALIAANPNDALTGVAWEDPWIHMGQSGYIGGEWTNSTLTATSGSLDINLFPGGPDAIVNLLASPNPIVQFDLDLAIGRAGGTNNETFNFMVYDAEGPQASDTYAYHSIVSVSPGDEVYIQDNPNAPLVDTGVSLFSGDPYHLYITVDYGTQAWTAVLRDTQRKIVSLLALNRPVSTNGYVLSGYTTVYDGWANVDMDAGAVSATNFHFGDTMVFDNYTVTQLAAPAQIPIIDPLSSDANWYFDASPTPGSYAFQNGHLSKVLTVPGKFRAGYSPGAAGTSSFIDSPSVTKEVGSTAADWTTQVALHADNISPENPNLANYASLDVYDLQDAQYDNELFISFGADAGNLGTYLNAYIPATGSYAGVQITGSDVLVRASYAAATHQLSTLYSVDGGVNWLSLMSFDVTQPTTGGGWGMTASNAASFGFLLEGVSDANSVTSADSVYFSNYGYTGLFPAVWPHYTSGPSAPAILTQPFSTTVGPGESASFSVVATGSPAPSYAWSMNGRALSEGTQPDGSVATGTSTAALVLSNVQPGENQAILTVNVSNSLNSVASSGATLTVVPAAGAPIYSAVDLGDLGGGSSYGTGINNAGTVVGYSLVGGAALNSQYYSFPGSNVPQGFTAPIHAFSYSNGVMSDLGAAGGLASSAQAINNAGTITGWLITATGSYHPFTFSNGAMTDLGLINNLMTQFEAINNTGGAAGSDQNFHAFVYSNGTGTSLGTLGGPRSYATGINDSGIVVGWSDANDSNPAQSHAFSYDTSTGVMTDLGTLNGSTFSTADAVNPAGVVAGFAINGPGGFNNAVTFENGGVADLGTIRGQYPYSIANAINSAGVSVGSSSEGGETGSGYPVGGPGELAVIYSNGQVTDLNTLVNLPGIGLAEAMGINDLGQIVANNENGRTFLLTPIPGAAPGISAQPVSQISFPGFSATFSVGGSGASLSYQWYLNGVAVMDGTQSDGSVVSGSNTSSLTVTNLQEDEDNASVAVSVFNPLGSAVSGAAVLSVTDDLPPAIAAFTPWQNVFAGNNASFSVTAFGATSYQWQDSTDGGATWGNLSDGGSFSGSATESLTVGSVTSGMNGYLFRVVATDAYGSTLSPGAPLNLVIPPAATGVTWGQSDIPYYLAVSDPRAIAGGVTDVEMGDTHTVFLKADGSLWATGDNTYGQLGDGTTVSRDMPEQVASDVAAVSAGDYFTMFVKTDGTLWGMGYNHYGQLGNGTTTDSWVPVQVPGATGVTAVSAGIWSTLFTTSDGSLWAMGDDSVGQLCDGGTVGQTSPIQVTGGVISIATGNNNQVSYFVRTDGTLWSVGNGTDGVLGDGTTNNVGAPEQVATGVATVGSNGYDTLFLKTDGTLWGMGFDSDSEFGNGEQVSQATPVEVAADVANYSIGRDHTMFVKNDGTMWALGSNGEGALGDSSIVGTQTTPVQVASGVSKVAAMYSTLFITTDGTLWACGDDTYGELGDNQVPVESIEISPDGFVAAQLGSQGKSLYLGADGTVWEQAAEDFVAPLVQLPGANGVVQLVSSCYNYRQLFLKGDGTLWQFNVADVFSTPVQVASGVVSAGAGLDYIVYLKTDGTLWAQGGDGWAIQFGDGIDPVLVDDHVVSFSAPGWVLLYVKSDGTLWGQGDAWNDGLAPGALYTNPISSTVLLDTGISSVNTNINQILFTTPDGTLWTMGDGFGPNGAPPVAVDSGTTLATGNGSETLYLKNDGILRQRSGIQSPLGPVVDIANGVVYADEASDASSAYVFIQTIGTGSAPTITAQPQPGIVQPGTSLTLQVGVDGTGPIDYKWYKNGAAIAWARTAQITIPYVSQEDPGSYYVVVTNSAGQVTSSTVTVQVSPNAASVTPWQTVFAGNSAVFTVTAPGATSYQWQESTDGGGTWTNISDGGAFSGSATATLTVGGVTSGMSGDLYRAVASNGAGSVTSPPAALTVVSPPTATGITWGESDSAYYLPVSTPTAIASGVKDVEAGGTHTAFLKANGTLWMMGGNAYGQLGDGTTASRDTPEQVASGVAQVSAGGSHTMFIKTNGTLWAMGNNQFGQLGIGTTTDSWVPVQVPGASGVIAVAAGLESTLYLTSDGALWAMGDDYWGELGDGGTAQQNSPIQVATGVSAIADGNNNQTSFFVKTDGTLWAMGNNGPSAIGDGTTNTAYTPEQVASGVATVGSNGYDTLFLKTDGTLWGMGYDGDSEFGDGEKFAESTPVEVASGVAHYSIGRDHTTFVKTDGTLWVMGNNGSGALGNPAIIGTQTTPVQVASGVTDVAAMYSTLFVTTDGTLWACGDDTFGELGDNQQPIGAVEISPNGFVQAQIGSQANSLFLKADGTVWMQPGGNFGAPLTQLQGASDVVQIASACYNQRQLFLRGDGTLWQFQVGGIYSAPTQVASGVISAAAGEDFIAYLKSDGTLWAQGGDVSSIQFGDGTDPVQVDDHVVSFSAPGWVLVYVKSDGSLWGQGAAWYSGLAPGNNYNNPISSTVLLDTGVTWVYTNIYQILFTTPDGTLWTLGDGFGPNGDPPVAVDSGTTTSTGDGVETLYLKPDAVLRSRAGYQGTLGPVVDVASGVVAVNGTSDGSGENVFIQTIGTGTAPTIVTQPQSAANVPTGTPFVLQASASGSGPLGYQWFRNGIALPWARAALLSVPYATQADAGTYHVVITNSAGTITSASATVSLEAAQAPKITAQPVSQSVVEGANATFTVAATGSPLPSYQWYLGGVPLPGGTSSTLTLVNVQPANAGSYTVVVANSAGSVTSKAATLTVAAPPAITTQPQPQSQTVAAGSSVTFKVVATGNPAPTYQWSLNGTPLAGDTKASLTLTNVKAANDGTYTVTVTNSLGSATSAGATLTVNVAPAITTQPASQSANEGSSASFSVVATGTPAPTYQWYQGSVLLSGATSATLTIADVQPANAGSYVVVVTNSLGTVTSKAATLTVAASPAITTQPQSQTVLAGSSVTFKVVATGNPAPTYQWSLNGTPLAGDTKASLTLTNVKAANDGTYTVTVTNSMGSVASAGAILTVNVAPAITTQPASQSADEGSSVSFTVVATGTPAPTYQWYLGGIPLSGATSAALTIANVQPDNAGSYVVVVTNSLGTVTSKAATLTVAAPPAITTQPQSQTLLAGSSVTFKVVATGNPAPTYQWSLNGTPLGGDTKASLTLTNVKAANDGTYTVTVTNSLGSVTSAGAILTVNVAPAITTQPASETANQGASASFSVVAMGTPAPTYQWYLGGILLSGATSATLTIGDVQPANAGSYTVEVTNSIGSVTSKAAALKVAAPPAITTQPQSQTVSAGSSVTFKVVATGNPAPTYQWSLNGTPLSGDTKASLTLTNVTAANDGTYTVTITNSQGSVTSSGATLTVN